MSTLKNIIEEHPETLSKRTLVALLQSLLYQVEMRKNKAEETETALAELNEKCEKQQTIIGRLSTQAYDQDKGHHCHICKR